MDKSFIHLYLWSGQILLVKRGLVAAPHQHMANQLVHAGQGDFGVAHGRRPWRRLRAALWDGRVYHRFDGTGGIQATVYLEPHSSVGQAAARLWSGRHGLAALDFDPALARRIAALARRPSLNRAQRLHALLCAQYLGAPPQPTDARLETAVAWLRARLPEQPRVTELAKALGLSPSRISRWFMDQAGVGPRRLLLWLRLIQGLAGAGSGQNLTAAAHQAGFADAAHFSRTCKRMMGLQPSQLAGQHGLRVFAEGVKNVQA